MELEILIMKLVGSINSSCRFSVVAAGSVMNRFTKGKDHIIFRTSANRRMEIPFNNQRCSYYPSFNGNDAVSTTA